MASIIQSLISATGKSADEIMEILGKKAAQTGDEISEQAVMKNLKSEAADVVQPIGSGKNLEALQAASEDIASKEAGMSGKLVDMQEQAKNAPFIDSQANAAKQFDNPDYSDMSGPQYDIPPGVAERGLVPVPQAPEVMERGLATIPRKVSPLDNIVDAELVSKADPKRMDPRLAKILGFGTAAGIGGAMLMGGDEEAPMAKEAAPKLPPAPVEQSAVPEEIKQKAAPPIPSAPIAPSRPIEEEEEVVAPKKEEVDFVKMMTDAQNQADMNRIMSKFTRAGELIGAGLSKTKANHDSSKLELDQANIPVDNAKGKIGAHKEQKDYNKALAEMNDTEKLRDPNSSASKMTKQILAKHGININSAKEAQDAGINVQNILLQDLSAKERKEIASMTADRNKDKNLKSLDEKQRKFAQGLRKEATTGALGKQYSTFATGQRMSDSLSKFAKNPSGYKDYATLMGGLKSLQGDESVVREAEVRLGMSATSAIDAAFNHLQKAATGKMLQPDQRKEMIDTINILTEASRQQYMHAVAPILEQADMEKIPHSMILAGSLQGGQEESQESPKPSTAIKLQSPKAPGSIITTKSGTYKVNPDGQTASKVQ